uniref:Uncharacterized protein n=1 Tax=Meloidogyne incognita TaxID=6306 RepID=A0A914KIV6_MELIC
MLCACTRACFFTHVLWLDILIVIVSTLVQPIPIVDHGYRALFQNGVFRNFLPQPYAYMLLPQRSSSSDTSFYLSYIPRYLSIQNLFSDGHIPRSLIWLMGILAFLLNLFHIILLAWADYPRPDYYEKMEELSKLVTQEAGITDVKFSSFTWAICVFKIRKYVREAFTLSVDIGEKDLSLEKLKMERLRDYNNQLTYALIVQAILPTFEVIAMSTQILLPIFYPSGTTVFIIVYTVIPLYFAPVINPLSTIFLVKPYRRAVLNKIFGRNNGEMTHASIKNNTGMPASKDQQRSFNTVAPIKNGGESN